LAALAAAVFGVAILFVHDATLPFAALGLGVTALMLGWIAGNPTAREQSAQPGAGALQAGLIALRKSSTISNSSNSQDPSST
jgi:hypothetical protein